MLAEVKVSKNSYSLLAGIESDIETLGEGWNITTAVLCGVLENNTQKYQLQSYQVPWNKGNLKALEVDLLISQFLTLNHSNLIIKPELKNKINT